MCEKLKGITAVSHNIGIFLWKVEEGILSMHPLEFLKCQEEG